MAFNIITQVCFHFQAFTVKSDVHVMYVDNLALKHILPLIINMHCIGELSIDIIVNDFQLFIQRYLPRV